MVTNYTVSTVTLYQDNVVQTRQTLDNFELCLIFKTENTIMKGNSQYFDQKEMKILLVFSRQFFFYLFQSKLYKYRIAVGF